MSQHHAVLAMRARRRHRRTVVPASIRRGIKLAREAALSLPVRLAVGRLAGVLALACWAILDRGTSVALVAALAVSTAYAALLARHALETRAHPRTVVAATDVALLLLLVGLTGGVDSDALAGLALYPVAIALLYPARVVAWVSVAGLTAITLEAMASYDGLAGGAAEARAFVGFVFAGVLAVANALVHARRRGQIEELNSERMALLHDALGAESRERARLGERLHDDALQALLAAHQDIREARSGSQQSLERADRALSASVHSLREIVRATHPAAEPERDIVSTLRSERDHAATRGRLAVRLLIDPLATGSHEALLMAAARELVGNVVKHAEARSLAISLERSGGECTLVVADDGAGIEPGRLVTALVEGHVGLASLQRHAAMAGGRVAMEFGPGTTVRVTVPAEDPAPVVAPRAHVTA